MLVATLEIKLYAPWVHSLKEKRMEVKSLTAKIRNRFNVAVAETAEQDTHQTIVIGVAAIAADTAQADSILDHVINFIESNSEAEIISAERNIYEAKAFAENEISIFAVSTFNTDYILLKADKLDAAVRALTDAGHEII